jgi:hypothetical protein
VNVTKQEFSTGGDFAPPSYPGDIDQGLETLSKLGQGLDRGRYWPSNGLSQENCQALYIVPT